MSIEGLKAFCPKCACELNYLHYYAFKSFVKDVSFCHCCFEW